MEVRFVCVFVMLFILEYLSVCEAQTDNDTHLCMETVKSIVTKKLCKANRKCKTIKEIEVKKKPLCCPGYKFSREASACVPDCRQECVGGICVAPNTCACEPPLVLKNDTFCGQPECSPPCVNADCVEDDRCKCHPNHTERNSTHCAPICPTGYENDPETLECKPKCDECINGYCTAPNTCACNAGYELNSGRCVPRCREPCLNGECVAPDTCECHPGYSRGANGPMCHPVCATPCINATCVEPDKCVCDTGYERLDNHSCRPKCNSCDNGECYAPDECRCFAGYSRVGDICEPICSKPCLGGYCRVPNTCQCKDGYELDGEGRCRPFCEKGCLNGNCTSPGICTCFPGYEKSGDSVCAPVCEACENGVCVSPGRCQCEPGYEDMPGTDKSCSPICSSKCINADCESPEECVCRTGYTKNSTNPSVCYKPCVGSCEHGTCDMQGECSCDSGYELFNGTCITPANCNECLGNCSDGQCTCENGRPCTYPPVDESAELASATRLAGLQLTWLLGGCAGIFLVAVVIIVIGYIWRKRSEYGVKPTDTGTFNGSVAYTMPDTLTLRHKYPDMCDASVICEEDEQDPRVEASHNLLNERDNFNEQNEDIIVESSHSRTS